MLIKFFINATNNGYLNGLASEFNESTNSIRKELNNLSGAGYLLKSKKITRLYIMLTPHTQCLMFYKQLLDNIWA